MIDRRPTSSPLPVIFSAAGTSASSTPGLANATLLMGRSYQLASANLLGDVLCLIAGCCYTGYPIAIGPIGNPPGPVTILTVSSLAGLPVLLASIALGERVWPQAWPSSSWRCCSSATIAVHVPC